MVRHRFVDKHQQRAEEVADEIEPDELRRLMYYLVDTVLDRSSDVVPTIEFQQLSYAEIVPIVSIRHRNRKRIPHVNIYSPTRIPETHLWTKELIQRSWPMAVLSRW